MDLAGGLEVMKITEKKIIMIATGNRCNSPADRGTKKHVYLPYRGAIPFWFYLVPLRLVRISQIIRLPGYEIHEKISLLLIIEDFFA